MLESSKRSWIADNAHELTEAGCTFSCAADQFKGLNSSYLKLIVHTDPSTTFQKIRGYTFDRFWSVGDMPQQVGELILQRCR
jgi:hypothetical protein